MYKAIIKTKAGSSVKYIFATYPAAQAFVAGYLAFCAPLVPADFFTYRIDLIAPPLELKELLA